MTDLERVKQDGSALQFVKEQTPEICMAAVKKDGWAIAYVKNQTMDICLAAVKQTPDAIKCITNPDFLNIIRKQRPELIAKLYDRP